MENSKLKGTREFSRDKVPMSRLTAAGVLNAVLFFFQYYILSYSVLYCITESRSLCLPLSFFLLFSLFFFFSVLSIFLALRCCYLPSFHALSRVSSFLSYCATLFFAFSAFCPLFCSLCHFSTGIHRPHFPFFRQLKAIEILTGNEAMATLTPVPLMDAPSRPPNARHIHNHQLGRQDSFSDMLPFLLEIVNLLPNTTSES